MNWRLEIRKLGNQGIGKSGNQVVELYRSTSIPIFQPPSLPIFQPSNLFRRQVLQDGLDARPVGGVPAYV